MIDSTTALDIAALAWNAYERDHAGHGVRYTTCNIATAPLLELVRRMGWFECRQFDDRYAHGLSDFAPEAVRAAAAAMPRLSLNREGRPNWRR